MKFQIIINSNTNLCAWQIRRDEVDAVEAYDNKRGDGVHFVNVEPFDISALVSTVEAHAAAREGSDGSAIYSTKNAADVQMQLICKTLNNNKYRNTMRGLAGK